MSDAPTVNTAGTGKVVSAIRAIIGHTGIRNACRLPGFATALTVAVVAAAFTVALYPAAALEIERKFEISEADLTQQVNALRRIYKQVWIDIRSEPKVFNGRTYSGFISIHARDTQNRYCRWDTVFDEVLKDFEPPFNPIPTNPVVANCAEWSNWAYIDKAIGDWTVVNVHPHFANFDGMPYVGNISAKGYYYPDRLVLLMRLRNVNLQDEIQRQLDPNLLPRPKLWNQ